MSPGAIAGVGTGNWSGREESHWEGPSMSHVRTWPWTEGKSLEDLKQENAAVHVHVLKRAPSSV